MVYTDADQLLLHTELTAAAVGGGAATVGNGYGGAAAGDGCGGAVGHSGCAAAVGAVATAL